MAQFYEELKPFLLLNWEYLKNGSTFPQSWPVADSLTIVPIDRSELEVN